MRHRLPIDSLIQRAACVLPEVDLRLRSTYCTASLGNKADPLDELVYIQLSIRTREGAYSSVYNSIERLTGADWGQLLELPDAPLLESLRPGGMAELKLARLRAQIKEIGRRFGQVSLNPLREVEDAEAEAFLESLPGVGPKAARCVLLYSLGRKVFPVDSHCYRVLDRLGFVPAGIDRKQAHDFLQALVSEEHRYSLHVNLVHHGRAICIAASPRCAVCPLRDLCPTGAKRGPSDHHSLC